MFNKRITSLAGSGLAILATISLLTSCDKDAVDGLTECVGKVACDGQTGVKALVDATARLEVKAVEMEAVLKASCKSIAEADGDRLATGISAVDACAKASAVIDAQGEFSIVAIPPKCSVNVDAQIGCEASCQVDATCDPGSIEARCEPGKLSVECEPVQCSGEVSCSAEVGATIACTGECSATCEGTCNAEISGTCSGTCNGKCDGQDSSGSCAGTCEGTCEGSFKGECYGTCEGSCNATCSASASAEFECSSTARCTGGCSAPEIKAPRCDVEIEPPSCDVDAGCQASCDADASIEAECTPGSVSITGDVSMRVKGALEAQLPQIELIGKRAEILVSASGDLVATFGKLDAEELACALIFGGEELRAAATSAGSSVKATAEGVATLTAALP